MQDHRDLNLGSLRLLLVADGANPWSLSSCDQFLSVFQSKGLRPDAICPCAASTEVRHSEIFYVNFMNEKYLD